MTGWMGVECNEGRLSGSVFCMPDPVGCSCMTWWMGTECNEGKLSGSVFCMPDPVGCSLYNLGGWE